MSLQTLGPTDLISLKLRGTPPRERLDFALSVERSIIQQYQQE